MALSNAERMRMSRERKKLREAGASEEEIKNVGKAERKAEADRLERESMLARLLDEVKAQDDQGKRFKSEARSLTRLVRLYYGQPEMADVEDEDEETSDSKKGKKPGVQRPNPSETRIQIQDTTRDPIEKGKSKKSASPVVYEVDDIVGFWRWLELRDRARKDLFWLGRVVGNGFYRSVHQITCDQFVQKNFGGDWLNQDGTVDESRPVVEPMYFEGYTLDHFHAMIEAHHRWDEDGNENIYGREIEMMLLDSRGFYKSTINGVDSLQWLLNCPDIRILIITGEYKLSLKFLGSVKKYFYLATGAQPTPLHLLFPEYVTYGKDGVSDSPLECPARLLKQDEPSLWVNSIVANLSGWHCDLKKGDDIVTDENSNNEEAREKIKVKYDGSDDLLDPHGFMDHIGTRYFTDDWYGTRLTPDKETGRLAPIKYHCRGCWTVKPEYADVPIKQLTAEMVTLHFPQRWSFNRLRDLLIKKGERYFKNQQLNEPSDAQEDSGFRISFTEDAMRAHMYQREAAPKVGDVYIVWDWALSDRKTSDYSVGVAARLYKNDAGEWSWVILEILCDKWKYSELAFQVIALAKKYGPRKNMIESSNGFDMLRDEINRVGARVGYQPDIFWKQPSREENAKRNRIKSLEILLSEHRLHFVLGPWMDETIKQFTQYTGEKKNKGRKDDIPDACSYLTYILPREARPTLERTDPKEEQRLEEQRDKEYAKQANYARMFGGQLGGTRTNPGPSSQQAPTWRQWLQGAQPAPETSTIIEPEKPMDPRMRIFGNKGPWRL